MLSKLDPRLEFTIQPQKVSHIICYLAEKVIFLGSGVFSVCSLVKIVSNMITYCINYARIQVFYDSYVSVKGQNVQGENTGRRELAFWHNFLQYFCLFVLSLPFFLNQICRYQLKWFQDFCLA